MFQTLFRRYLVTQSLKLHKAVTLVQNRHIYVTPGDIYFRNFCFEFGIVFNTFYLLLTGLRHGEYEWQDPQSEDEV